MNAEFDISDLRRRMQGAIATLKHELGGCEPGAHRRALSNPCMSRPMGKRCR